MTLAPLPTLEPGQLHRTPDGAEFKLWVGAVSGRWMLKSWIPGDPPHAGGYPTQAAAQEAAETYLAAWRAGR